MKTCLVMTETSIYLSQVMVTIIKFTWPDIANCNIQNCFVHPNGLTVSTEISNLNLWSDNSSNEIEN